MDYFLSLVYFRLQYESFIQTVKVMVAVNNSNDTEPSLTKLTVGY